MVVGRAIRASGCHTCRISIVRSFTSLAGPSVRSFCPCLRVPPPASYYRPRFSSSISQESNGKEIGHEGRAIAGDVENPPQKAGEPGEVATVPWYLQVDSSQKTPHPISERQRIPELPDSSPEILGPMLRHLSVDQGLDDLALLDLRKLDPPPALGANLIMIISTARSEKHLHVSADRFCRWLRSMYGLRPDADGLLGRNELKLKLRRKARRAKLLGSTADENDDDGIQSGWICIDVGTVESRETTTEEDAAAQNFVGFGRRTDGVTLVVQMLTEEKREVIDLEGLWGGILRRGLQQQQKRESTTLDSEEASGPATGARSEDTGQEEASGPAHPSTMHKFSAKISPLIPSQRRGFHTSTFGPSSQPDITSPEPLDSLDPDPIPISISPLQELQQQLRQSFASGKFSLSEKFFLPFNKDVSQLEHDGWRLFLLDEMHAYLESVKEHVAIKLLGNGENDRVSTPYIVSFSRMIPEVVGQGAGKVLIDHHCYAMEIGHPGYTTHGLREIFARLQAQPVPISQTSFLRGLRAMLAYHPQDKAPPRGFDYALELLRVMQERGHNVLSGNVFLAIQETLAARQRRPENQARIYTDISPYIPFKAMSIQQQRTHQIMMTLDMPLLEDDIRLRLLDLYAQNEYWPEFWGCGPWPLAKDSHRAQSCMPPCSRR